MKITIVLNLFEVLFTPSFILNRYFLSNPTKKRVFSIQNKKNEHHHRIQYIRINLNSVLSYKSNFNFLNQIAWIRKDKCISPLNSAYIQHILIQHDLDFVFLFFFDITFLKIAFPSFVCFVLFLLSFIQRNIQCGIIQNSEIKLI